MYEFNFFAIKKLLGTYITTSAITCSLIALVSLRLVGKPWFRIGQPVLLANGQALFGWSRNGVSQGGGLDSKDTSG